LESTTQNIGLRDYWKDKHSQGDWYLLIKDTITGNKGYLNEWKLDLSSYTVDFINVVEGAQFSDEKKLVEVIASSEVAKVEFYINDNLSYTDDSYPFAWEMDLLDYNEGNYQLKVKAYDTDENLLQTTSRTISVVDSFYCVIAYPNPARNKITFEGSGVPYATIKIYTLDGEEIAVIREDIGSEKKEWSLNGLPSGIYFYQAENVAEKNFGKFTVIK